MGAFRSVEASFREVGRLSEFSSALDDTAIQFQSEIPDYEVNSPRFFGAELQVGSNPFDGSVTSLKVPDSWVGERLRVPPLSLTQVHEARVFGGRITQREKSWHRSGQLLLDRSFRWWDDSYGIVDGNHSLPSDILRKDSQTSRGFQGTWDDEFDELDGTYLFLGSIPRHFGHFLIEGLSRCWPLLNPEVMRIPNLKFLVYEPEVPNNFRRLLLGLGVRPEMTVSAPKAARVERLLVPSPSSRTHRWIRREQVSVWRKIAARGKRPAGPAPSKVFLSRGGVGRRQIANREEIEGLFSKAGFVIAKPETMDIFEQIGLVFGAGQIAGPVGSQMYLSGFQAPGGRNIVLAPRNFFLKDDAMISGEVGHRLSVVLGSELPADQDHEDVSWTVSMDAVRSALDSTSE